jgi:hypothetical protein
MTLDTLISRLETVEEGSRELDAEIYTALGATPPETEGRYWTGPCGTTRHYGSLIPAYTTSLDSAMSLVPEGAHTEFAYEDRHRRSWKWSLRRNGYSFEARGNTAALALCIASLRARSSIEGGDRG